MRKWWMPAAPASNNLRWLLIKTHIDGAVALILQGDLRIPVKCLYSKFQPNRTTLRSVRSILAFRSLNKLPHQMALATKTARQSLHFAFKCLYFKFHQNRCTFQTSGLVKLNGRGPPPSYVVYYILTLSILQTNGSYL